MFYFGFHVEVADKALETIDDISNNEINREYFIKYIQVELKKLVRLFS
jgi:hypothetical protein